MKYIILFLALISSVQANELECLAKNIYFESRGEPEAGQFMVGFVTMNRVRDKRWPNTICKVVYQHNQFEWTQDKYSNTPLRGKLYNKAIYIASIVMQADNVEQYGYYFKAVGRKSRFFNKLTKIATVYNHEFYK
jgi:spore germination cell wall hydrolase CwlJ-like protein